MYDLEFFICTHKHHSSRKTRNEWLHTLPAAPVSILLWQGRIYVIFPLYGKSENLQSSQIRHYFFPFCTISITADEIVTVSRENKIFFTGI